MEVGSPRRADRNPLSENTSRLVEWNRGWDVKRAFDGTVNHRRTRSGAGAVKRGEGALAYPTNDVEVVSEQT